MSTFNRDINENSRHFGNASGGTIRIKSREPASPNSVSISNDISQHKKQRKEQPFRDDDERKLFNFKPKYTPESAKPDDQQRPYIDFYDDAYEEMISNRVFTDWPKQSKI